MSNSGHHSLTTKEMCRGSQFSGQFEVIIGDHGSAQTKLGLTAATSAGLDGPRGSSGVFGRW